MKVYCGSYRAPIRSVCDSFCADVCNEHVHQVWLQQINSFRRYTTGCTISHAYNFLSQLQQNDSEYQKTEMVLFSGLDQTCHMQILVMNEPKLEAETRKNCFRKQFKMGENLVVGEEFGIYHWMHTDPGKK
ncbi:hypothetical protein LDENG_00286140 [Lucifuga dentata]|nr:hypothetical protein LDENG_00286140 [Lucifuga dentata]